MQKIQIYYFLLLTVLVLTLSIYKFNSKVDNRFSFTDGTYLINGEKITLKNGLSEIKANSDSKSKIVTRYFGNQARTDLDNDGSEDLVFLLTQETGGTGTFFYVVALLNTSNGPVGSQALYLGDRIAPQTTEIGKNNIIVVNYAERKPGESFAVKPSFGKSIWLKLDLETMQFGEVVQNFEGEADPARMKLDMKIWKWINTIYNDGKEIKPSLKDKFTLILKNNGTFSATTDCNGIGGEYIINGSKISFEKMMSTLMYCEGSQESDFSKSLNEVDSYFFTSKGELIFNLKFDSGSMIFR